MNGVVVQSRGMDGGLNIEGGMQGWKGSEECMDGEVLRRENMDDKSRGGSA